MHCHRTFLSNRFTCNCRPPAEFLLVLITGALLPLVLFAANVFPVTPLAASLAWSGMFIKCWLSSKLILANMWLHETIGNESVKCVVSYLLRILWPSIFVMTRFKAVCTLSPSAMVFLNMLHGIAAITFVMVFSHFVTCFVMCLSTFFTSSIRWKSTLACQISSKWRGWDTNQQSFLLGTMSIS